MVIGSAVGLWSYYEIGWYAASLIGAAASFLITLLACLPGATPFEWDRLTDDPHPETT